MNYDLISTILHIKVSIEKKQNNKYAIVKSSRRMPDKFIGPRFPMYIKFKGCGASSELNL